MRTPLIIAIGAIAVLGSGVVLLSSKPSPQASDNTQTVATSSTSSMREYQSTAYHFSLLYPEELIVNERSEGGGATTITFQNIEKSEGFQIFIVPYSEPQVSEQRFRQDEPSGVRESLKSIVVGGATGGAFYSKDATLGDTREIWIVHGGFLYEVTTHKTLDTWLAGIIQTWKFISSTTSTSVI